MRPPGPGERGGARFPGGDSVLRLEDGRVQAQDPLGQG